MNYTNLLKLQQIIEKTIKKADFELAKELIDLLSDFIMESREGYDEWSELYIECKDYYDYAKARVESGCELEYLLTLEEFIFLQEDEFFEFLTSDEYWDDDFWVE